MQPCNPPLILVRIKTLKDRGGLPHAGRDAQQHKQFTDALVKFLLAEANGRFFVGDAPHGIPIRVVSLEGDLSRTDIASGGAYLCVLRLREETTGCWIGQWAGTADNFRFLYGNLTGAEGISLHGLLGELGVRVVACLVSPVVHLPKADTAPVRVLATRNGFSLGDDPGISRNFGTRT